MNISFSPDDLLSLYETIVRDSHKNSSSEYSLAKNSVYQKIRFEILRCLEKDNEEKSAKQFQAWNQNQSKKIEVLEKINNDVKITSDMIKKFNDVTNV